MTQLVTEKYDIIEKLQCGSIIQHGKYNNRIYLMKLGKKTTLNNLSQRLITKAKNKEYSKIFIKAPLKNPKLLHEIGFKTEASVPNLYDGSKPGYFLAYYVKKDRAIEDEAKIYEKNLKLALKKKNAKLPRLNLKKYKIRACKEQDAKQMAKVYQAVFESYPFPIQDPDYIVDTMKTHVDYYCIEADKKIVALASSEIDYSALNTEMTDFATLPDWRGNNFGVLLLNKMENEVQKKGIKTAYTIARAASPAMNIIFSKLGYTYRGRLKNNTNISGGIESMNVWDKKLAE